MTQGCWWQHSQETGSVSLPMKGRLGQRITVSYVSALGWRLGSLHLEDGTAILKLLHLRTPLPSQKLLIPPRIFTWIIFTFKEIKTERGQYLLTYLNIADYIYYLLKNKSYAFKSKKKSSNYINIILHFYLTLLSNLMDDLTSTFVSIDFLVERYEENLASDSYVVRKKEKYF